MFSIGVSGVWLDGTEPQRRPAFDSKVGGGKWSFGEVANPYSLLVSQAMYNGMRAEFPNKRVMNLTRSSFVGQQRYGSVVWSGDVAGTWEQLSEQIPAGINYSVTGAGYWTHDIGGFFRDSKSENAIYDNQYTNPEYIELLTRWFQFGALSPIFRIHGYNSQTEIWRYGAAFEATARKFIDLRYRLLPYIYSTAWQMTREGEQLMTPLAMHYPKDRMTWSIKDQSLFGESLMVAIVTNHGARTKEVYLPKGVWYDYWSDAMIQGGGTVTVDTPLDSTPIFVKAGAVMAYGGRIQHADDVSKEPLQIKIYAGADGEFTLYFDDKRTYGYERGEYSEVEIEYDDRMREVEIEVSHDGYRKFQSEPLQLEIVMAGEPSTSRIVEFRGKKLKIKL